MEHPPARGLARRDSPTGALRWRRGNPASTNPPLYYLSLVPSYEAASGGDLFDRVSAMRLDVGALPPLTVTAAWLLAGEIFGPTAHFSWPPPRFRRCSRW